MASTAPDQGAHEDFLTSRLNGVLLLRGIVLPAMDDRGLLPPATHPYETTLDELHQRFVVEAPFREQRQRVFDALSLYASLVWDSLPTARLRIDGGFITHKTWAAPEDADVVVVYDRPTPSGGLSAVVRAPLFTMSNLTAVVSDQSVTLDKAPVMGGLIDAYPAPADKPAGLAYWDRLWSNVTGPGKTLLDGERKGYVEVTNPNAEQ
ncbi:hypothetical protein KK090_02350 [Curtobacterium flaccumfaciens pv. poinsettiae]|uniref:DUF6932 family protein n=1 Tax=Curtobacterium poinsettiae TaxID=159612 RepID=UPI001BE02E5C|nr:hypothetical protein [Curtobacterium flaccumfaciens]MBT1618089.1 hypothetical protein [Curtobacterium flaccumfaciens pv. poinsettiae]